MGDEVKTREQWIAYGAKWEWVPPPPARLIWRFPVIRYFRWFFLNLAVARHSKFWVSIGYIPTGYDNWVLYGVSKGWV